MPLLAWALTGDASNVSYVSKLAQPARLDGYKRFSLHNRDYPAVVKHEPHSSVDGYLLILDTTSQRRKLDDFEGEIYKPVPVDVTILDSDKRPQNETVEADVYLWAGDDDLLAEDPWELEVFEKEKLEDWLDLFGGMELVGEDEE